MKVNRLQPYRFISVNQSASSEIIVEYVVNPLKDNVISVALFYVSFFSQNSHIQSC